MLDYLDTLKAKPPHVRQQIAMITTVLLSLLIVSVWWGGRNSEVRASDRGVHDESPTEVVGNIFADMKNRALSKWSETTGQLKYAAEQNQFMASVGAIDAATTSAIATGSLNINP